MKKEYPNADWEKFFQEDIEEHIEIPAGVMEKIDRALAQLPEKAEEKPVVSERIQSKPNKTKRRFHWLISSGVAAAVLLVSFVATYAISPTVQQAVRDFFQVTNNTGYQIAQSKGLVEIVNYQMTDKDTTLSIEEILPGTDRIRFLYDVKKKNGQSIGSVGLGEPDEDYTVTVYDQKTGEKIESFTSGTQPATEDRQSKGILEVRFPDEVKKKVVVEIKAKKIWSDTERETSIWGTWKIKIPVDLTKVVEKIQSASGGTYQNGENSFLQVNQLTRFGDHELLFFTSSVTEKPPYFGDLLHYDLLDANGNIFFSTYQLDKNKTRIVEAGTGFSQDNKSALNTLEFEPFPESPFYTFRLKGIYKPIVLDKSFPYVPGMKVEAEGLNLQLEEIVMPDNKKGIRVRGALLDGYEQLSIALMSNKKGVGGYKEYIMSDQLKNNGYVDFSVENLLNVDPKDLRFDVGIIHKGVPVDWETRLEPQPKATTTPAKK